MLLGGDEARRTQRGNNNAYCQDNETSWFDWTDFEQQQEIYRFVCGMIAFRAAHPVLSNEQFYTDTEIRWFNPAGGLPDWFDPKAKSLACLIKENEQAALLLMFNAAASDTIFDLPPLPQGLRWHPAVDTSGLTPQDVFVTGTKGLEGHSQAYRLQQRSSAILLAGGQEAASGASHHGPKGLPAAF